MTTKHPYRCKLKSLNAEIFAAERRLALRRTHVTECNSRFLRHLHQRMTAPLTLLLAGGTGFMFAELTKRRTLVTRRKNQASLVTETTGLSSALHYITLIYDLYTVLPLILLIKSWINLKIFKREPEYRNASAGRNMTGDYTDQADRDFMN